MGVPTAEFSGGHATDGHGQVAHSLSAAANADHADDDDHHGADIHDVSIVEWIAWTPFLLAIVVFGVFPNLMFKVFDPAVTQLVDHLGAGIPK
jgi:NADH-quinone oxidoreductase subunit M